ncbi:hypothetical protein ACFV3R_15410 [Streptomyces sp. NPDC059740]|uniref:hypothetical protein n=1 Tax=Streptomyces sp. NPDC059740 TaxID=3346926 RepID=UPI00364801EC
MDAVRVALLREVLAGTPWVQDTRRFAGSLRAAVTAYGGGLLLVGSEGYEPWHMAAHLDDEAAWAGLPELSPVLVRHRVPPRAPAHLSVGLDRLRSAGRGRTLLVVTPTAADPGLLEHVHDARRGGATVLVLDSGDRELHALAHEALAAPPPFLPPAPGAGPDTPAASPHDPVLPPPRGGVPTGEGARGPAAGTEDRGSPAPRTDLDLDMVQHLVSAAAGENGQPAPRGRRRFRDRLARLADQLTDPPSTRW